MDLTKLGSKNLRGERSRICASVTTGKLRQTAFALALLGVFLVLDRQLEGRGSVGISVKREPSTCQGI